MKRWHKVGIGFALAVFILLGLGLLALSGLQRILYPVAPPMPAVVGEPLPDILARLERVIQTNAPQVSASLQPGLSTLDISQLEKQYHVQLPEDIRAIYRWHNGSRPSTNDAGTDFIPGHRFVPLAEALAERPAVRAAVARATWLQRATYQVLVGHRDSWICLFDDGAGDGYWFDPKRKPDEGSVFYNMNETATYVFFPSARNLMAGVARCYQQGAFHLKAGSVPPQLEENYELAEKIWGEFAVTKE